jgi:hypothetical protein
MSITKRLPWAEEAAVSAKGPQSEKKMLPVELLTRREWGPSRGAPSY